MRTITEVQPDIKLPRMKKIQVYTAILTQTGTNDPDVTVLHNTLGKEVIWAYNNVGRYEMYVDGNASVQFKEDTTAMWMNAMKTDDNQAVLKWVSGGIWIYTQDASNNPLNGVLEGAMVEIRKYNVDE